MIPREIVDEIVYRSDITEVIGRYVTLKRAGSNYNGLCPFHSEKTPSFTVFPATNSFYCFGCSAGGDVITFVMKAENLDYVPALEYLAKQAGVTIPAGTEEETGGIPRRRVYDMNLAAAKFFRECLFDPALGKEGMAYLADKRKLSLATIRHFGLGYAPNDFGMLGTYMKRLGFTDEEMTACYLRGKSQKGNYYDLFRNRVMFPIIDTAGNIIAFGGRVMDDSKPKYLNSSDTPGFKKSRNLFALSFAKNCCAEQMILCEGYMDVIALHAAGFENAVATLGTALTGEQARLFARYTKKVIITYDSDAAGQNAAEKAIRLLGEVGVEVRVLKLEGAKDPDEYVKKYGAEAFRRVLDESKTGFDHRFDTILQKYRIDEAAERIRAANEVCTLVADMPSAAEREVHLRAVAEKLGLTLEALSEDTERIRRAKIRERRAGESREAHMEASALGDHINPEAAKNVAASGAENVILGLLMLFDEYRAAVAKGEIELHEEDFFTAFGRKVFAKIMALETSEGGYRFALMGDTFTPDEMGRLQKMTVDRSSLHENGPAVLRQSIETLKNEKGKMQARENTDVLAGIAEILARKAQKK